MNKSTKYIKEKNRVDARIIERIAKAIENKGWKPVHLGRALGFSDTWSHNLMKGKRSLSVNLLLEIAEKLGVHPASLLPDTMSKETPKNFEEYIESVIMDIYEKKIIPRIKKEFDKK